MATLREVRTRIIGVKKTQKITKAMKMVAAAKLRRAQAGVIAARPYARKMMDLLCHLVGSLDVSSNSLILPREIGSIALVVVTSDRGLCGAFNTNLLRAAVEHVEKQYAVENKRGNLKVFCVGRKGFEFFSRRQYNVAGKHIGVYNNLVFGQAQMIARQLVDGYMKEEFDKVEVIYNEFKSVAQQRIVIDQFLPVSVSSEDAALAKGSVNYIYEPNPIEIVNALLPKHLDFQMWRVLLESNASEQGARMAAMDNATENANEMISMLQLAYNKARQASITKELLEVVGGAEALKKTG
ncbi:MAG: ATP synthase F1 subunit gamma [Ignavibacteria bacterium]|nr:ATP synthase F1 subunit gamma [Ignavibacteria bacterium]